MKENTKDVMDKYDKEVSQFDDIQGVDLKINPDYYFHICLVNMQNALSGRNGDGFIDSLNKYQVLVDHFFILAKASDYVPDDYEQQINQYKESSEYRDIDDANIRGAKLANFKFEMVVGELFAGGADTRPLKIKRK